MELNSEYHATYLDDFIGAAAAAKGKAVVMIRSWGWNNTSDVAAINASREFYKPLIPLIFGLQCLSLSLVSVKFLILQKL